MGLAAIGLAEMEDLIAGLKTAKEDIRGDIQWLSGKTSEYLLSSEFTDSADRTAEWIDEVLPGLRRRLALAQQIERSTPGIQTEITIDEADLPTASPHEARESADEVADKIAEYLESDDHSEIPPEILRELENHTGDPYFDEHLAKTISPEDLGRFIELMGDEYHDRTHETARDIGTDVEYEVQPSDDDKKFAEEYGAIAEHLGISIGNSSFSWSNEQRIAWTQQFGPGAVAERSPGKYEERAFSSELGWLMTFGIWSPQTVEETVYDTYASEQFVGKGSESWPGFTLPNGEEFHDPMAGALVQVSKNPELAQKLFDPDAIRHDGMYMFRTVEEVEDGYGYVKEESRTATTRNLLEYLLVRDWNDEGAALQASLGAAIGPDAPDFDTAQRISGRLDTIAEEMAKAAEEAEKENSGPMAWVHTALDVLGLVPVVGELFDGLNGLIYTAEGDFVNAGLSYAGMIPFVGWGSTAAKGIKGAEALTSMRAAREVAENAADVASAAGRVGDDLAVDLGQHYGHLPSKYDTPEAPRVGDAGSPGITSQPELSHYEAKYRDEALELAQAPDGSWHFKNPDGTLSTETVPYINSGSRPKYLEGQVDEVWANSRAKQQQDIAEGNFPPTDDATFRPGHEFDPNTPLPDDKMYVLDRDGNYFLVNKNIRTKKQAQEAGIPEDEFWNMGHQQQSKYSDLVEEYKNGDISQAEFMYEVQKSENYFVEGGPRNQSHVDE